jgi:hypothetical protein
MKADVSDRIWVTNLGQMFDKVVDADRRGIIDDRFYAQLLDFFYCFLPVRNPSSNCVSNTNFS